MSALTGLVSVTLGGVNSGNPPTYGSAEGIRQQSVNDKYKEVNFKLVFGDNASTYPSGGIPLATAAIQALNVPGTAVALSAAQAANATFGMRNSIKDIILFDASNSDGYVYKIDKTNLKLRIYQGAGAAAHTHDLLLKNAAVADGATTRVNAGANLLGANTGSDITVTGAGANGGVKNSTALADLALNEVSTSFVPASNVSLYGFVRGR